MTWSCPPTTRCSAACRSRQSRVHPSSRVVARPVLRRRQPRAGCGGGVLTAGRRLCGGQPDGPWLAHSAIRWGVWRGRMYTKVDVAGMSL